ncbi:hypothetical protein [Nocardia sp. NPDC024068]|uniref:hypothetical protein n=1 Tax=Nocardia sp. NPDC024068 TaxID=3157197 RepID=UPI0034063D14
MDTDSPDPNHRGSRRKPVIWVIVGVVGLTALVWWFWPESRLQAHMSSVEVEGYVKVAEHGALGNLPSSTVVFVGPAVDDVGRIISAPDMTVRLLPPEAPTTTYPGVTPQHPHAPAHVWAGIAVGDWDDGCNLSVDRIFESPDYQENLLKEQVEGIRDGSLFMLKMVTMCGEG